MNQGSIKVARRYAKALISLCDERGDGEQVRKDLDALAAALALKLAEWAAPGGYGDRADAAGLPSADGGADPGHGDARPLGTETHGVSRHPRAAGSDAAMSAA
jgi:hypothetical protein